MVVGPADHPWSSYAGNSRGRDDSLVCPHALYQQIALDDVERRALYRDMVSQALIG